MRFDRFKCPVNDTVESYIIEFEILSVKTKKYTMELP